MKSLQNRNKVLINNLLESMSWERKENQWGDRTLFDARLLNRLSMEKSGCFIAWIVQKLGVWKSLHYNQLLRIQQTKRLMSSLRTWNFIQYCTLWVFALLSELCFASFLKIQSLWKGCCYNNMDLQMSFLYFEVNL